MTRSLRMGGDLSSADIEKKGAARRGKRKMGNISWCASYGPNRMVTRLDVINPWLVQLNFRSQLAD